MDISLTPEQEKLVHRKVETGRYTSASELIDEAFRLIEERDRLHERRTGDFAAEIAAGVASLREGRTVDGEAVFDRLEAELDAAEQQGA